MLDALAQARDERRPELDVLADELVELREFDHPVLETSRKFLDAEGVGIAGVEFIDTDKGRIVAFDVNTNYDPDVGHRVRELEGVGGPDSIARHLGRLLATEDHQARRRE